MITIFFVFLAELRHRSNLTVNTKDEDNFLTQSCPAHCCPPDCLGFVNKLTYVYLFLYFLCLTSLSMFDQILPELQCFLEPFWWTGWKTSVSYLFPCVWVYLSRFVTVYTLDTLWLRPRPLSYVVLDRIHIWCFPMCPQSDQSGRISSDFYIVGHFRAIDCCTYCLMVVAFRLWTATTKKKKKKERNQSSAKKLE